MIDKLPPRERQLFEALYSMKQATASELLSAIENPPSNSAVRVMLRRLEAKGFVSHREESGRFVYSPAVAEKKLKQSALKRFVETYFAGSPLSAATALLGMSEKVSDAEIEKLEAILARVRKEQGE